MADSTRHHDVAVLECLQKFALEHKTARKTGKPRRIPIGRKLGELLTQAIGERQAGMRLFVIAVKLAYCHKYGHCS